MNDQEIQKLRDTSEYLISKGYDADWLEKYADRLGYTYEEELIMIEMFKEQK